MSMQVKKSSYQKKNSGSILALTIKYTLTAQADLDSIKQYISRDNPLAAKRLIRNIKRHILNLKTNPSIGQEGLLEGTREWVVSPNYIVVYRIELTHILVFRIRHVAQDWPPR